MSFEDALKISFIDGIPGNAAAYVQIRENVFQSNKWTHDNWELAKIVYYLAVPNPASAWIHDILKNRCHYNNEKTYEFLCNLLKSRLPSLLTNYDYY